MRWSLCAFCFVLACSPPVHDTAPKESSAPTTSAASAPPLPVPPAFVGWSREEMIARGAEIPPKVVVGLVEDERTRATTLEALPFMPGSEDALVSFAIRARERRSTLALTAMERILSTARALPPPEDAEASRTTSRVLAELARDPGELGVLASNVIVRLRARGLVGAE